MNHLLWKQDTRLSIEERISVVETRINMSERDRDLTHPDIILLISADEFQLRSRDDTWQAILTKLKGALSAEVARRDEAHWAYDYSRHERLVRLVNSKGWERGSAKAVASKLVELV